ncbi:hypothetical protein [Pseudomonas sp. KB_12]|uniref:hypothetical protein n=1 Tax=Pseudomonas sp. KB_12 TaxID=3233034 RepID=UPI003F963204
MPEINVSGIAQVSMRQAEWHDELALPVVMVKNTPSVMRFKETAQFILQLMPRKNYGETGVDPKYWLEIKDPKHRDRISLNGLDGQSGALSAWKEDTSSKAGLFQWIDQHPDVKVNQLKEGPKHPLSQNVSGINYVSVEKAVDYQVTISQGEWKIGGELLDTTHLTGKPGMEGHAAIVVHRGGNIFVHPYEKGKWQHTSTTAGQPVLAAGMIRIEQGRMKSFHLDSGHYAPLLPQLRNILIRLSAEGVNINDIDVYAKHMSQDDVKVLVSQCSC